MSGIDAWLAALLELRAALDALPRDGGASIPRDAMARVMLATAKVLEEWPEVPDER